MPASSESISTGRAATESRFRELKEWIAAQEAADMEAPLPPSLLPSLSETQKRAADELQLVASVKKDNWIGLLQRYRDAHPNQAATIYKDEYVEDSGVGKWTSTCKIGEAGPMTFPAAGYGKYADTKLPPFDRKKDARQYAAKWAIHWLREQKYMPDHGDDVKFAKPKPGAQNTEVDVRDDSYPATQRVPLVCKQLGIQPPQYDLEARHGNAALFTGQALFSYEVDVPSEVGRVECVYGRKNAREEIARQVLEFLLNLQERRSEQTREIMSRRRSGSSTGEDDEDGGSLEGLKHESSD